MAGVMIGTGPHKASHTAVAISGTEEPLGELRVRQRLLQAIRHGLKKIQYRPGLIEGCLVGTGLSLEPA